MNHSQHQLNEGRYQSNQIKISDQDICININQEYLIHPSLQSFVICKSPNMKLILGPRGERHSEINITQK